MSERKEEILKKIVENYIEIGNPITSSFLVEKNFFDISSATLRSEMAELEKEGLLKNIHTSSGRIPTEKAYKQFVLDVEKNIEKDRKNAKKSFEKAFEILKLKKAKEKINEAVNILSHFSENISFATIPNNEKNIYLGIGNILKKEEFQKDLEKTSSVIEVFEGGILKKLETIKLPKNEVKVFIGKENIFEQFDSCSMLVIKYDFYSFEGIIGILGPMRINYSKNIALLEEAKSFIEGENYVKKLGE